MNDSVGDKARSRRTQRSGAWFPWPSDERGSVTVMVALAMVALIGLLALGVDLGALFNARSEAQRAADAAALAGASAFLEHQQSNARTIAERRATEFATSNAIRGEPIAPEELAVSVDLERATVRAAVRRDGVPTWFARLLGVDAVDVGAEATAWAAPAGAAQCVKPFAVPDLWHETTRDLNQNRIWDEDEQWRYEPGNGDWYIPYTGPGGNPNATGYGSSWRDSGVDSQGRRYEGDYGRLITIKVTDPRAAFQPSFFLPWVLPADGDQADCGSHPGGGPGGPGGGTGPGDENGVDPSDPGPGQGGGWFRWLDKRGDLGAPETPPPGRNPANRPGGGVTRDDGSGAGAARYRQNICSCNKSIIDLDTEYLIEPGNMVGPTYQGVQALIAQDPDAYWDEQSLSVVSQHGMDSPRVVTVALFDPGEITSPGRQYIRFNNFARIFIEEQASRQDPVTGRFLYFVPGVGLQGREGQTTGSLVRVLQLIR
jgi:Tfp pilus assembly protein PilX